MHRILAIDLGEVRIGLAVTDPTQTIASPLGTVRRRRGKRPPWAEIQAAIDEREAGELVVGLPLDLEGEDTDWTREVRDFAEQLQRRTGLPVHLVDERMTSVRAERAVRSLGLKRSQREEKGRVDAAAAALILEAYLAQRNHA